MSSGMVSVYIEGLLVQERAPESVMKWAWDGAIQNISGPISREMHNTLHSHLKDTPEGVWAHHFKNYDGFVVVKPRADKANCQEILVSLNETNHNSPSLKVHCKLDTPILGSDFVAALVSLALYYGVDDEILGDVDGEKETE